MTQVGAEAAEGSPAAEADPGRETAAPAGDPGLATERDRLARSLRETRLQLAMTQARLSALEGSATMELGRTLVRAARRPWSRGVQLPADLVRLWRERGGLTGPGAATLALASAQLSDLSGVGERFLSALSAPGLGEQGLVVTGVMTAGSAAALAPDAAVLPLLPHDADVMLESAGADLVLIEAAAMLAGSAWAYAGDPAGTDRGRRLGRLIAAGRALGKPVIFIRNVPAQLAPGLDWVASSCDAVSDDGFGVQLARFNPIGRNGDPDRDRVSTPVYAAEREPREPPMLRALLDDLIGEPGAGAVQLAGAIGWARRPAFYAAHHVFVTASAEQAREQLACGAQVIAIGGEPVPGTVWPGTDPAAVRAAIAATPAGRPWAEVLDGLRGIFATHATAARLGQLAELAGLGPGTITGRQIAVLARADGATAAAELSRALIAQRFVPAEVVVVTAVLDPAAAGAAQAHEADELACRAIATALGELSDRGVAVRVVAAGAGPGEQEWMRHAARAARSPWAAPWPPADPAGQVPESYLLDLACARECSRADAVGTGGGVYAFAPSLAPALARREHFDQPGQGLRLFSFR